MGERVVDSDTPQYGGIATFSKLYPHTRPLVKMDDMSFLFGHSLYEKDPIIRKIGKGQISTISAQEITNADKKITRSSEFHRWVDYLAPPPQAQPNG
jgi:hypothetical protein